MLASPDMNDGAEGELENFCHMEVRDSVPEEGTQSHLQFDSSHGGVQGCCLQTERRCAKSGLYSKQPDPDLSTTNFFFLKAGFLCVFLVVLELTL